MSFKKYNDSTWQPITPKKLKGIPYTGTLPATLTGTKAGYLHRYKIYGNTEQTGTPTPENPIVPSECGERTGNIWTLTATDFSDSTVVVGAAKEVTITGLTPNTQYTLSSNIRKIDDDASCLWFNGTSSRTNGVWDGQSRTAISSANGELKVYYRSTILPEFDNYWYMLNKGSTALPYEPYGYKLPLTSAGQGVDIYLGESQTTRRIKKLVLKGQETWSFYGEENVWQFYTNNIISGLANSSCMSNIAKYGATASTRGRYDYGAYLVTFGRGIAFQMKGSKDTLVDVAAWKAYLAAQYANGTPVTVWYVLATPTTGTLNEPLRKIVNYADTIDSTQTSAQIPTSAGSTTISWAGSGLAPSQFDSIQEWADIPTYTYTNGEWVADN